MFRRHILPLILVATTMAVTALAADPQAPQGGRSLEPPTDGPCLTPAQRAQIWANIELNRDRLRAEGLLDEAQPGVIVLFDWPLVAAPSYVDPGYHGISNFVDQDPDPGELLDYNCGQRTYDLPSGYNHRGIDYYNAPFSWYKMDYNQVFIVAAAPGTIIFKQDGNYDRNCGFGSGDWNAVYIEHIDGSISWYGHMKEGSLTPKEVGETVVAGEFLGVIGSSGNSTGPHLHFETYDDQGSLIEPYDGPCNMFNDTSWWLDQRAYYDTAINALKTHDAVPEFPDCPQQEIPHERESFTPGSTVYFGAYYRDEVDGLVTDFTVRRPDDTEQWAFSLNSDQFRSSSFWYWERTLPGDAPEGLWTFRATVNGDVYEHFFTVCDDDNSAPVIDCPDDITVECNGSGGTSAYDPALWSFLYGVSATDNCDTHPIVVNNAPEYFPFGETIVTFTATDDFGNESSCFAMVTVEDSTPPEITCPDDITVECSAHGGTPVDDSQLTDFFAAVSATDNCDPNPVIDDDAPDLFPVGTTLVTFTATDGSGNDGTCTASVTVEDTTPPEIAVELNRYVLWPPNHKMVTIYATVEVEDICCADPTFELTSIASDEPDNGTGDGDQENDIQGAEFGTADLEFQLRSERAGTGDGRVYTIVYTAFDCEDNATEAVVEVRVPHNQSGIALAGAGFTEDLSNLLPLVEQYSLIIPSSGAFDPSGIDAAQAYVGNHVGALTALDHELVDLNHDGLGDLVLDYDAPATLALMEESGTEYPVGMHYRHAVSGDFEIWDIFDLGMSPADVPEPEPGSGTDVARLFEVTPNPLVTSVQVAYQVPADGQANVRIEIYNVAGQRVRQLVDASQAPGVYVVTWDGRGDTGSDVPSGVYFMRTQIGREAKNIRIAVAR